MARCGFCDATIFFGGARSAGQRFCDAECRDSGRLVAISRRVPDGVIACEVRALKEGACSWCGADGPVGVRTGFRIWSALVYASVSPQPRVACRGCGLRHLLVDTAFCMTLGWWSKPGIVLTPILIGRNVLAMARRPAPDDEEALLETIVRLRIGQDVQDGVIELPEIASDEAR